MLNPTAPLISIEFFLVGGVFRSTASKVPREFFNRSMKLESSMHNGRSFGEKRKREVGPLRTHLDPMGVPGGQTAD
jgi:hypothetical protein